MGLLKDYLTTPKLLARALVTLGVAVVYVIGVFTPGPGVDTNALDSCSEAISGYFGIINVFGAGALARLSPFALGVLPFITISIVLVLGSRVFKPAAKITSSTKKFVTVFLIGGLLIASGNAFAAAHRAAQPGGLSGLCPYPILQPDTMHIIIAGSVMLAGCVVLLGLAEVINRFGIGNGLTTVVVLGIALGIPFELARLGDLNGPIFVFGAILALIGMFYAVVRASKLTRELIVPPAPGSHSSVPFLYDIPFNLAGIMPVVLANILIYAPTVLASAFPEFGPSVWIQDHFSGITSPVFVLSLITLTVLFTFYQVIVSFDAEKTGATLNAAGFGFLPPGSDEHSASKEAIAEQTVVTLDKFYLNSTIINAAFLSVLAVVPSIAAWAVGINTQLPLGGSSILILAVAALSVSAHAKAVADYQLGRPLAGGITHPDQLNKSIFTALDPLEASTTPPDAAPPSRDPGSEAKGK